MYQNPPGGLGGQLSISFYLLVKMSIKTRNDFLEGSEDENEDDNQSAESEVGRGGVGGRLRKRRKVQDEGQSDDDSLGSLEDDDGQHAEEAIPTSPQQGLRKAYGGDAAGRFKLGDDFGDDNDDGQVQASDDDDDNNVSLANTAIKPLKKSTPKSVLAAEKAVRKSGVIYISRVPPFMKPSTLRHFLAPHAPKGLGRIFLTPEDHTTHLARKKRGGNKKKSFTDGWVEFKSKTEAKAAAEMLNGEIIGGKKGNFYHDDLWNIKYLKGFKWGNLTEQIAAENAEREARLREEVRRTKEENKRFVEDVERGKMIEGIHKKRKEKGARGAGVGEKPVKPLGEHRAFKQKKARDRDARDEGDQVASQRRVLGMIL